VDEDEQEEDEEDEENNAEVVIILCLTDILIQFLKIIQYLYPTFSQLL